MKQKMNTFFKDEKKIFCLFVIVILLFSTLVPTLSLGQSQETTTPSSELLSEKVSKYDELLSSTERVEEASVESSTNGSSESISLEESTTESSTTSQEIQTFQGKAIAGDILSSVVVNDWELFRDKNGSRESLTAEPKSTAASNQAYTFGFSWTIVAEKLERNLLPGDYFVLEIPQVEDSNSGHWYAPGSAWSTITIDTEEGPKPVYRYRIEHSTEKDKQVVRVEFLDGVDQLHINTLDTELEFPGFMNYVMKEGTQQVTFGQDKDGNALAKAITFEKTPLNAANGFSYKFGGAASNNTIQWGIQFNGAANVELGGDEVNYSVNGGAGSQNQGFYLNKPDRDVWNPWGSHYTDVDAPIGKEGGGELGGYVEDVLPAGAELAALTIAAYIQIPIGLTPENYNQQTGVYPSSVAGYQSFVLADYGSGPTYRSGSDTEAILKPKVGTGFSLLTQGTGETKAAFKQRIQSTPYQYGVYKEASGVSTVMMHYGSLKKADNQQQKLSELTTSPYTGRTITNPISNQSVNITEFAAQAADFSIKLGYYAEEDRELLENYYSITYGDSNVIKGASASYNISLAIRYPPDTPSGEIENTSEIYTHSALTLNRPTPEAMPKRNTGKADLQNPYGSISLNANQVLLQKFDVERDANDGYIPINGAKFKLQVKNGTKWADVKKSDEVVYFTTDGISYYEIENGVTVEKIANGLVKVDFSALGLADGTYRFVETEAAAGYDEENSPSWNGEAVVSDEFAIPSATSKGPTVTVCNKKLPQAKYTVKHYVQKNEVSTAKDNFRLDKTEEKSGYIGQKIIGEPLLELLTSYNYSEVLSIEHGLIEGRVTADGELIIELYYTIAAEVPFTFYKQGLNGDMMPSVDSNGNQLFDEEGREKKVVFDIYEYIGPDRPVTYPDGTGPKSKPGDWNKLYTVTTDALGRIRVPEINDPAELAKYYAIVEVETYPGYVLPENKLDQNSDREVYWVVRLSDETMFSMPSWAHGTEVDKPDFEKPSSNNNNQYILKNRKPEISLFKVNERNEPMPSSDKQKVQFDIYRWTAGGYFNESDPYYWSPQWMKLDSNVTTDNQGYFASIGKTGLSGSENKNFDWYAIRETSTYSGYQLAEGYWLVKTGWNPTTQQFEIFDVKYKVVQENAGIDAESPGHKISDDKKDLYLTNKVKATSFYKEDGQQNPLGGVHFSLYKPKAGEAGETGSEDPEAVNTKWDLTNPIEKISSESNSDKGKVTFEDIVQGDYLLVETKTLPGYQLPLGSWIITINFYGEIEAIKGRGDPLPPAFRVEAGNYYLPNYLINSLPKAGGYMRMALVVLGIVLLGSGIILSQNRKKSKRMSEKGKEDEKKNK
ncbi:SpaA isopeptide-forming pilin-related protein [Enterococcus sp. AZ072]|uniref:prealbumin-like fold domain-containing protein n=1 Tax=unclassified Enterococcus TaxID=2608891 RepID=UPI003D27C2B2